MTEANLPPSPDDQRLIDDLVRAAREARERGEPDAVAKVCADRPDLLLHVRRRLAPTAVQADDATSVAGIDGADAPSAIGPYRVVREIGSGGMGRVYLAEQLSPVRRRVALKVIKLGMDTREVVARFHLERQALAMMNHPHIAQVFDAGITPEGRPYFVMEYVSGLMLRSFCDHQRLTTHARVSLMATICRAVQHAHDRGFLHRDLKPSNILVDQHEGQFVPKIIDFGIAKATAAAPDEATPTDADGLTRAGQVLGTPEYMSPEQMLSGGRDIDTRTDVYSLGVTLYELLCGELPFDGKRLRAASRHELERILHDELPTQPSKRLSRVEARVAAARGGERSTVQRAVAGELDWITLKALAKRRADRYPSALALAEDLERWVRHEPVLAAPPGSTYRLRKFVRRHRITVAASTAVLASLVTGLVISLRATSDALAARDSEAGALADMRVFYDLARTAVGNLVDVASTELVDVPQAEPVRQRLLADAKDFYEQLRQRQPRDPTLRRERLGAITRIGSLLQQTGASVDAIATFEQCIADGRAMLEEAPGDTRVVLLLVDATSQLARTLTAVGRSDDAKRSLYAALDLLARARAAADPIADGELLEARLLGNLAIELDHDNAKAIGLFERAIAIFERLAPGRPDLECERAQLAVNQAEALTRANRLDDAAQALAATTSRLRALPAGVSVEARDDEARVHDKLASVLRRLDRRGEARAAQERAIATWTQLAAEHPAVPSYADHQAAGWHFLAQLWESDAKLAEARAAIGNAVRIREELAARQPQNHRFAMRLSRSLLTQADLEMQSWQHDEGSREAPLATLERATAIVDPLLRLHPNDPDLALTHHAIHGARGAFATTERRFDDAIREHEIVRTAAKARLASRANDPDLHYQLAMAGSNLVQAHLLADDAKAATAAGEEGLRHLEQGLALDARNQPLRQLIPTLVGRLSVARFAAGDAEGAVQILQTMASKQEWGSDAHEQGCLLLGNALAQVSDHPRQRQWRERLAGDLQRCITARGTLAEAMARPGQREGISLQRSALRDYDLRVAAADVLGALGRTEEQRPLLSEARTLLAVLPDLAGPRLRNLFAQIAELALADGDPSAASAAVDDLLTRSGPHGGANYLIAVLYAKATAASNSGAAREQRAKAAVDALRRAFADGEVTESAGHHENFACLRGREDYENLFDR